MGWRRHRGKLLIIRPIWTDFSLAFLQNWKRLSSILLPRKAAQSEGVPTEVAVADVTFEAELTTGGDGVLGSTIVQLILDAPMFTPIEGIPDQLWKDQHCSNCHEWSHEMLCAQGQTYLKASAKRALGKSRPYGGGFKQNVRVWAANDCK